MSPQLYSFSEAFVDFQVTILKLSGTNILDIIQQEIQPVVWLIEILIAFSSMQPDGMNREVV